MDPIEFAINQTNQTGISFINKGVSYFSIFFRKIYSKLLVAAVLLLVGFIVGKILGNLVKRMLHEFDVNVVIKKTAKMEIAFEEMAGKFVAYSVYFITIIMALNQLNITTTILQMIYLAVIIIIVVSILLALKDFIPNLFAGFFIYKKKFIKDGEIIKIRGMEGKVVGMDLLETKVQTKDGDMIYIPNSALTKTEITKVKEAKKGKVKK